MSIEQEVIRIGRQLEKIVSADQPNEDGALDLLRSLQDLPMTLDLLQKSRVGLSVNTLRKKCSDSEVSGVGKKLIKQWKKLVAGNSPKASPSAPPTERRPNPPSPPPATYNPHQNGSKPSLPPLMTPITNGEDNSSQPSLQTPTTPLSPLVPQFSSAIDGSRRVPDTGNAVRDRCRDMIYKAMKKGMIEVIGQDDTRLFNLSASIEDHIYSEFKDTNAKYKTRIRSRVANIGDIKNPGLKQRVISGMISPQQIATMSTEEMASDDMKKLRQTYIKESIRDSQMAVNEGTKTDLLKCTKCGKRNCTYNQMQTRSADEPMTTFVYCNECGNRWKFC